MLEFLISNASKTSFTNSDLFPGVRLSQTENNLEFLNFRIRLDISFLRRSLLLFSSIATAMAFTQTHFYARLADLRRPNQKNLRLHRAVIAKVPCLALLKHYHIKLFPSIVLFYRLGLNCYYPATFYHPAPSSRIRCNISPGWF